MNRHDEERLEAIRDMVTRDNAESTFQCGHAANDDRTFLLAKYDEVNAVVNRLLEENARLRAMFAELHNGRASAEAKALGATMAAGQRNETIKRLAEERDKARRELKEFRDLTASHRANADNSFYRWRQADAKVRRALRVIARMRLLVESFHRPFRWEDVVADARELGVPEALTEDWVPE